MAEFKSNVFNVLGESSILKNILLTRLAVLVSNFLPFRRNDGLMQKRQSSHALTRLS